MRTRFATAVTAGFLLASSGAFAQGQKQQGQGQQEFEADESTFQNWDANGNGQLSKKEFTKGAKKASLFKRWDGNNDKRIDRSEFDEIGVDGDFGTWDGNNSGYLDPNELYNGIFASNDGNQDGRWSMEEWEQFGDRGWFNW